ncbi:hydroxylysine kinase [Lampris incognitus]|uniref:hydroxylysine kinase n=1 Tax=Lampris incognitus TaxID=2546036 RepID=UPI0024B48EBB|nr:hydroxylysine kinase [Lampris incognitus]
MSSNQSKPRLSEPQVAEIVQRLYGLTLSSVRALPSYDDQNFQLEADRGARFVLKVMNSVDSQNQNLIEVQTHAMTFLHQHGLPVQTVLSTTAGELMSLEEIDCGNGCQKYLVRLLTYLPGITISTVAVTPKLLYETGKIAARMDKVLQEMDHPHVNALQRENFIWSLSNIPLLENYLCFMDGAPLQNIVKAVIDQYKTCVVPKRCTFRKSINHGDFNDLNMLVEEDQTNGYKISGILDFSDMSSGYYVYELAITIMYMMIENPRPVEVGGPILAGWESEIPLNEEERDALYLLVLSRFSQSLLLAQHAVSQQPENEEYLMTTAKTGKRILCQLWELGKEEVEKTWFQMAAQYADWE